MTATVSVYGVYVAKVPVWQRYWIKRKDGVRQRYWKKTKRLKKVVKTDGRYEFSGTGRDLQKAMIVTNRFIPRGFITISARRFLEAPELSSFS